MATLQLAAQALQGAKLKLLDSALRFTQLLRDIPYALLLHETLENDRPLVVGQFIDQAEQLSAPFHGFHIRDNRDLRRVRRQDFPRLLPGTVRDRITGDTIQPRRERRAPPLVSPEARQRSVEDLSGQIFRL